MPLSTANFASRLYNSRRYHYKFVTSIPWNVISQKRHLQSPSTQFLQISEEVRQAIASKAPVVALESAIYTHGFPYPENVALASRLESIVRMNGAIPATVGVLNGVARVGFEAQELIELASSAGKSGTIKVSRRDLGHILGTGLAGRKLNGGTTVSGTMVLAERAGIHIFATGGLGGVHRGGENSLDISADLTELGRTKMAVISSGCKSFLDIPRTLEVLETQGVGVCTFADGRSGHVDFPAFWSRDSGVRSPTTIYNEEEAAAIAYAQFSLPLTSGLLFANPIPQEHAIAKSEMDMIITQALRDAAAAGSTGNENTPFILDRIRQLSNGRTVAANQSLVEANVARASKVAVWFMNMLSEPYERTKQISMPEFDAQKPAAIEKSDALICSQIRKRDPNTAVVVAGSIALDLSCDYAPESSIMDSTQPRHRTSNPARIEESVGGVGLNIATALSYMGTQTLLCSAIANDAAGRAVESQVARKGLSTEGIQKVASSDAKTAQYIAFNDGNKDLVLAMADMRIFESNTNSFNSIWRALIDEHRPRWLVVDANWDPITLRKWLHAGRASGAQIAFEPVSVEKSRRLFAKADTSNMRLEVLPNAAIDVATPNVEELGAMFKAASGAGLFERDDWFTIIDAFGLSPSGSRQKLISTTNVDLVNEGVPQQSIQLLPYLGCIFATLGKHGVLVTQAILPGDTRLTSPDSAPYIIGRSTNANDLVGGVYMRLFPPARVIDSRDIVSVNGAGDTFLGALIAGLAKDQPKDLPEVVSTAQRCAAASLESTEAVNPGISILSDSL